MPGSKPSEASANRAVRAWLYTIAPMTSVNRIRHQRARGRAVYTHLDRCAETKINFDLSAAAAIHQAIDPIEPKHREFLLLFFLEDCILKEIAGILDCPLEPNICSCICSNSTNPSKPP